MNDLRTQDTNTIRQKSKANDSRAGDALTCPLGCAELVFSRDDLKWEHVRSAHPECLSEALEEHIAPAATDNIKNPPVLKSNDVILEGGAKSPSVESMKVEPLSRSSTPKRPPSGNPVQQSNKTRQALHSPKLPLRDSRASLSVPSTSRKRSASDVASATPVPRHPPQQQSLEAQPRVVRSGESKLGISGSSGVDSKLPPVMGHARNHPSLSNVNLSADQYEQPNRLEQPVIHDSEEAGLVSAHYPDTGIAARSKSFSMAKAVGKPSQLSTNDPPQSKSISYSTRGVFQITAEARYPGLIMQPDSRPISHDQLAAEVKGIYGGLVMVEGKCISVDSMQMSPGQQFTSEHWQALVALHRTLLHEHHDFLLASQHPSANSALRKLAAKYSMPGRMWKHGIHSFLELMRRYLPDSREYMIAFILLAYQMMALLYETVPAFEQTWIECLGDLGRYRMAVEEDDYRDRETWGGVARSWYSKAADQSPEIGRLYHHLAILAGPNALQKLFYYVKALTCEQPFPSARESILTLFDPLLSDNPPAFARSHPGDANFIRLHAMLYGRAPMDHFEEVSREYINQLDGHIGRVTAKWNEAGVYTAVANIAGILDYGSLGAQLFEVYQEAYQESVGTPSDSRGSADKSGKSPIQSRETSTTNPQDTGSSIATDAPSSRKRKTPQPFEQACRLALDTLRIALNRIGDKNILPHVHVFLVFVLGALALPPQATQYVFERFPWDLLAFFLNTLASSEDVDSRFQASSNFWKISSGDHRPLPEDFLIRGQIWCRGFFPDEWFNDGGDVEERMLERASTSKARAERILWIGTRIGTRIGSLSGWLRYDPMAKQFFANRQARDESPRVELNTSAGDTPAVSTSSEEDSKEMDFVKQSETCVGWRPRTGVTHGILMSVPQLDSSPAAQLVVRNFTVLVFDTSMLLNQLNFFIATAQGDGFDIVIPDEVIVRIRFLDGVLHQDDLRARRALEAVKTMIDEGRRVIIKNVDGKNVTSEAFTNSNNQSQVAQSELEDITIGLARRETDRDMNPSRAPSDEARPAVLITEDRKMRVKANGLKVAAIASSFLSKVIVGARRRSISREPGSS